MYSGVVRATVFQGPVSCCLSVFLNTGKGLSRAVAFEASLLVGVSYTRRVVPK